MGLDCELATVGELDRNRVCREVVGGIGSLAALGEHVGKRMWSAGIRIELRPTSARRWTTSDPWGAGFQLPGDVDGITFKNWQRLK